MLDASAVVLTSEACQSAEARLRFALHLSTRTRQGTGTLVSLMPMDARALLAELERLRAALAPPAIDQGPTPEAAP
jgi:hypothetical protein